MDERDAMAAEEILRFALFKEVLRPERRKRRKLNNGIHADGDSEDGEGEEEDEEEEPLEERGEAVTEGERQRAREKAKRIEEEPSQRRAESADRPAQVPMGDDDDEDMARAEASMGVEITADRYVLLLFPLFPLFLFLYRPPFPPSSYLYT